MPFNHANGIHIRWVRLSSTTSRVPILVLCTQQTVFLVQPKPQVLQFVSYSVNQFQHNLEIGSHWEHPARRKRCSQGNTTSQVLARPCCDRFFGQDRPRRPAAASENAPARTCSPAKSSACFGRCRSDLAAKETHVKPLRHAAPEHAIFWGE